MMLREFKMEADQNSLSESLSEYNISASVKQNGDPLSWIDNLGSFPLR